MKKGASFVWTVIIFAIDNWKAIQLILSSSVSMGHLSTLMGLSSPWQSSFGAIQPRLGGYPAYAVQCCPLLGFLSTSACKVFFANSTAIVIHSNCLLKTVHLSWNPPKAEWRFAPHSHALFRRVNFQKVLARSTACFAHFDLEMCFPPQQRALFRHRNFQKWSENGVLYTYWLGKVLRATTACTFSTCQLPKALAPSMVCFVRFESFWIGDVLGMEACGSSASSCGKWCPGALPFSLSTSLAPCSPEFSMEFGCQCFWRVPSTEVPQVFWNVMWRLVMVRMAKCDDSDEWRPMIIKTCNEGDDNSRKRKWW